MTDKDEMVDTLKEFFGYLDIVEVSDSGHEFHPVHINCCRLLMMDKVEGCITKLRSFIK